MRLFLTETTDSERWALLHNDGSGHRSPTYLHRLSTTTMGKRFKNFKGWLKEKTRRAAGTSPALSACSGSPPNTPPSVIIPKPDPFAVPTASIPYLKLPPAPSISESTVATPWTYLGKFLQVLAESAFGLRPLRTVVDDLFQCFVMHEDAVMARRDYQALKMELEALFKTLSTHFAGDRPPHMTASMNNLCSAIRFELDRMLEEGRGTGWRYLEAQKDLEEVMGCYHRIKGHLERLTLNADLSTWRIVDQLATDIRIDKLRPSMSASYNSAQAALVRRRECTPETRKEVLAELSDWKQDREQGNIFWLNGMAGTGKTTIATTLCAMLERTHDLGASFFCTRLLPECRDVNLILPTIAYQLSCFSYPFRCALSRALESDPNVHTKALPIQLEGLIIGPLREVSHTLPTDLVVVIDALDECAEDGVEQILEILVKHASQLPIKIFVASRPEPQIQQKIGRLKSQLVLHELNDNIVKGDIELYLRTELECLSLSDSQIMALVERAGVLFIYAATVVRYIGEEDFSLDTKGRLESVLAGSAIHSSNKTREIDELYTFILSSALDNPKLEPSDRARMEFILHTVICAQEPLTVDALAGLLQMDNANQVRSSLRRLRSVLHIDEMSNLVSTLHASFSDFILDMRRSNTHGCNAEPHHGRLAELCFQRLKNNKQLFNVCELKSSFLLDEQVPSLEDRVKRAIPLDLAYSCQYWALHLERGGSSSKHMILLDDFLSTRLLLWMEVLNLKKRINIGPTSLEKARKWCVAQDDAPDKMDLIHDAWRFVYMFAANPVSRSTPHIYVSMLASWPKSSPVAERYLPCAKHLVEVTGPAMTRRELGLLGVFYAGGKLEAVMFSPDGTRIISGSHDNTVRVWDARSGQMVLKPLVGHTDTVYSVGFSPDGVRIVSGSGDTTLLVWDTQSGQIVLGPLDQHTDVVLSVAFSPDGTRIISGSKDKSILVWDGQSGQVVLGPLKGHTDAVNSTFFSPDGACIASGSWDSTIRIWDSQSGHMLLHPFQGHTDAINSIAFSPDGKCLASGSKDDTIRVWDVRSGQMVSGPLNGRANSVHSVFFSPDGTRIVSASWDNAVLVWDVQSGQVVLGPLKGPTGSMNAVAFSPDGERIVSGSSDRTIRVWDARSGQMEMGPSSGHTALIYSVAFSPDGMHIVSGSVDTTIRLWDLQSGEMVLGPLEGHTHSVSCVSFSPDGLYIVSGSWDQTVRVWDSRSGEMVLGPLNGHTGWVYSVKFSPDSKRIVSGSCDNTIRVWDLHGGHIVLGPLQGHTDSVCAVTFSPDGTRIASGSYDNTVLVWDAQSGQVVLGPLNGHINWVYSVSFSPDGMNIVSGSLDGTVRVWDSQSGKMVMGPLGRHIDSVNSVTFSPDGMCIVSGSDENAIRVFDGRSGRRLGLLKGHTGWVYSIAFSPDGTLMASGSGDQSVRVWRMPNHWPVAKQMSHHLTSMEPVLPNHSVTSFQHLVPRSYSRDSSSWTLDEDGWVLDEHRHLLLWVPYDLRDRLLRPLNTLLISTRGSVQLVFDHARIGELWTECYSSYPHNHSPTIRSPIHPFSVASLH